MARMKFLCDAERCIECNGCVTACKNEHEVPWGVNRRRVVTLDDGKPGEKSISVACMHCTDAPCQAVCPVDCFNTTDDGIVLHDKSLCIGCGYCFYACPFGAPQFPEQTSFGARGKMDKCTFCAGGPDEADLTDAEYEKYGRNRIAEGKLPLCAEMCSTRALIAGDGDEIADEGMNLELAVWEGVKVVDGEELQQVSIFAASQQNDVHTEGEHNACVGFIDQGSEHNFSKCVRTMKPKQFQPAVLGDSTYGPS